MQEHKVGYFFIVMASVVIVLAGVKSASPILIPFLLSLFIAIILSPAYNFFKSKGLPELLSIVVVMIIFSLFLTLIGKLVGASVVDFSSNIDIYSEKLSAYYISLSASASSIGISLSTEELASMMDSKRIMTFATSIFRGMGSAFTDGFVIMIMVISMLLESSHFAQKIDFADTTKETIKNIEEIFSKIKNYMVIKALISISTGLIVWLGLMFIGTDYAFLWGVLAFLLNFIPTIGSIIAAVPAILVTLVQLGAFSAGLVAVLYLSVNVIIGSIIEPKVMGKGLGLSTLVVFLSLLFWGWLLGIVGMLLSIPLTIMAKIAFDSNKNTKWISVMLGTGENIR